MNISIENLVVNQTISNQWTSTFIIDLIASDTESASSVWGLQAAAGSK